MSSSLLPEAFPTTEIDAALGRALEGWPQGRPAARLLAEYCAGRRAGVLDVSGRSGGEAEAWAERPLLVVDDADGSLSAAAVVAAGSGCRTYDDSVAEAAAVADVAARLPSIVPVDSRQDWEALVATRGDWRVVMRAPKALSALEETLEILSGHAAEFVLVGREKHMTRGFNALLSRFFGRVDVSPAVAKSRMLVATEPLGEQGRTSRTYPRRTTVPSPVPGGDPLEVHAHGGVFSGTRTDPGSALLVSALVGHAGELSGVLEAGSGTVLDVGCGNGWLLAATAQILPTARTAGVEVSRAAAASARGTTEGEARILEFDARRTAELPMDVLLPAEDGAPDTGEGFDLVLLNPPFHTGHEVETRTAHDLVGSAHTWLRPGGVLVCVFNSHLRYRPVIDRAFGQSSQWARNRTFTVLAATKEG